MQALYFLIDTLFQLYITVVMIRFMLQLVRADFYNPISQFVVKVTSPLLNPFRKIVPGFGGIDWASLVLAIILMITKIFILTALQYGIDPNPLNYLIAGLLQLLSLSINIIFFIVLLSVIASWLAPGGYNPAISLLSSITEPLLSPIRRAIPPIAGMDLSPMVLLLGLQFISILLKL
jgi:YggT family protein